MHSGSIELSILQRPMGHGSLLGTRDGVTARSGKALQPIRRWLLRVGLCRDAPKQHGRTRQGVSAGAQGGWCRTETVRLRQNRVCAKKVGLRKKGVVLVSCHA